MSNPLKNRPWRRYAAQTALFIAAAIGVGLGVMLATVAALVGALFALAARWHAQTETQTEQRAGAGADPDVAASPQTTASGDEPLASAR